MEYIASQRVDFCKGDLIDRMYVVEKVLGEGTFGRVYKVRSRDGQVYALKLLKLWEVLASERAGLMRRFDMEYETGKIPSNYLVRSFNKGVIRDNPYILMEFCAGGDLMEGVQSGSVSLPVVATQVLYGLRDLHKCGKVHRDLKPENVLLRDNHTAVLTDFGISGDQNNRLTERGINGVPRQLFGTFGYMPPEQINPRRGNATVLPTTDIFSFGVMMYQLLTGSLPFGPLHSEADLPSYIDHGKRGIWDQTKLRSIVHGQEWMNLVEGCLIPDFKSRLQCTDEVLKLVPKVSGISDLADSYKSISSELTKPQMRIVNGVLLRVMQGEEAGRVYKLDDLCGERRLLLTMGRLCPDVFNVIGIKEADSCYVSRCHCTLEKNPDTKSWLLRDGQWRKECSIALRWEYPGDPCGSCTAYCGRRPSHWKRSTNGTYINSTEVDQFGQYINPGDIITVGDVKLRVEGY